MNRMLTNTKTTNSQQHANFLYVEWLNMVWRRVVAVVTVRWLLFMLVVELLWVYGSALRVAAPTVVVCGCGGMLPNFFEWGWEIKRI